jgi:hypothetical protein
MHHRSNHGYFQLSNLVLQRKITIGSPRKARDVREYVLQICFLGRPLVHQLPFSRKDVIYRGVPIKFRKGGRKRRDVPAMFKVIHQNTKRARAECLGHRRHVE